jgi:hypothetical protein
VAASSTCRSTNNDELAGGREARADCRGFCHIIRRTHPPLRSIPAAPEQNNGGRSFPSASDKPHSGASKIPDYPVVRRGEDDRRIERPRRYGPTTAVHSSSSVTVHPRAHFGRPQAGPPRAVRAQEGRLVVRHQPEPSRPIFPCLHRLTGGHRLCRRSLARDPANSASHHAYRKCDASGGSSVSSATVPVPPGSKLVVSWAEQVAGVNLSVFRRRSRRGGGILFPTPLPGLLRSALRHLLHGRHFLFWAPQQGAGGLDGHLVRPATVTAHQPPPSPGPCPCPCSVPANRQQLLGLKAIANAQVAPGVRPCH